MIETKFDLGSDVNIKVCSIKGIVVGVLKTAEGVSYKVAYQNHDGGPEWSCFSEIELESFEADQLGFGRKL